MKIGIDLRIFQIGHQYRGIGSHIKNLIREFSKLDDKPELVLYEYPNIKSGIGELKPYLLSFKYEVRKTKGKYTGPHYFIREFQSLKQRYLDGDAGLINFEGVDVLMCVDFNLGVPKKKYVKTVLISYDLIPWILSDHYLPNFLQTFTRSYKPRKALKASLDKRIYFDKIKQASRRAGKIVAISSQTKDDLVNLMGVDPKKIDVILLGIRHVRHKISTSKLSCKTAKSKKIIYDLSDNPYIFYMGGADRRRRIEDLIHGFSILRDKDMKINLVLAGFDFKSFKLIPDAKVVEAIKKCKYKDNIFFAGFINEKERDALFYYATAFVFPSIYEGFGLPILEAMDLSCPVITYDNSSITEVGGDAVVYASNGASIADGVELLSKQKNRRLYIQRGQNQVKKFSWMSTARQTLDLLEDFAS